MAFVTPTSGQTASISNCIPFVMCTGGVQRPPHLEMELGFPNFWEQVILNVDLGCLEYDSYREIWYTTMKKISFSHEEATSVITKLC